MRESSKPVRPERVEGLPLVCHPDTPCRAIHSIFVWAGRRVGRYLTVSFRAVGDIDGVIWPGNASTGHEGWERADNLWQHSCFELFGTVPDETGYFEVNIATSGKWAAYAFFDRREGMRIADDVELVSANWSIAQKRVQVDAMLGVPLAYENSDWLLGFTAVIEEKDGSKSYWALSHGAGPPDFHNRDCFTASLAAPDLS